MIDVAVVCKEDTGVVLRSAGTLLGDEAEVMCDRSTRSVKIENAYLISIEQGAGHGFDGADFDPDCAADARHRVNVKFEINVRGERVAYFRYILKPGEKSVVGDPFYCKVINGRKTCEYVKSVGSKRKGTQKNA